MSEAQLLEGGIDWLQLAYYLFAWVAFATAVGAALYAAWVLRELDQESNDERED